MSWVADNYLKFALGVLLVIAFLIRGDLFSGDEHHDQEGLEEVHSTAAEVNASGHATEAQGTEAAVPVEASPVAEIPAEIAPVVSAQVVEVTPGLPPVTPAAEAVVATEDKALTPTAGQQWTIEEYWIAARTAYWIGDLQTAEMEYANILSREPGNWQAHQELGHLYARTHRYDKAVAEYHAATMILNKAAMYEQSRKLAVIMAELYPAWKDKPVVGLGE